LNIHKKFFSKVGFNYLILAVSAIIIQVIAINAISMLNIDIINDYNYLTIMSAVCNYILPLPIILFLMKKIETRHMESHGISVLTFLKYFAITLTLMWAGNLIGLILTSLLGGLTQTTIANPVENLINSTDVWLNLLLISIIGPIFEEYFFRKLLVDRTIRYGARISIILSAVIFGFFHGNLNQFFYAFLMGGFLAYVYIKTGTILYPILLHICANLMGSVVSLFVGKSAMAIAAGNVAIGDLAVVLIYTAVILLCILIGLISLTSYKKSKFNGLKTEISLTHPLKTMLLNYGMILFMVFCVLEIVYQII